MPHAGRFLLPALCAVIGFALGASIVGLGLVPTSWSAAIREALGRPAVEPWARERDARIGQYRAFPVRSDVAMVGDSLTAFADWASILPDVRLANRGVNGDTTADTLSRLDTILSVRARIAFIQLGVNDIAAGRAVDAIEADYRRLVIALKDAGSRVVVLSTLECARDRCGDRTAATRALNGRLRGLARELQADWVDLNAILSAPGEGLRPQYTYDGVHLTAAGYAAWRDAIGPLLTAR